MPGSIFSMNRSSSSIAAAEIQRRFDFFQDQARQEPVLIAEDGRTSTVLLSFEEFQRLSALDRQSFSLDELPPDIVAAILEAEVPDDLEAVQT